MQFPWQGIPPMLCGSPASSLAWHHVCRVYRMRLIKSCAGVRSNLHTAATALPLGMHSHTAPLQGLRRTPAMALPRRTQAMAPRLPTPTLRWGLWRTHRALFRPRVQGVELRCLAWLLTRS